MNYSDQPDQNFAEVLRDAVNQANAPRQFSIDGQNFVALPNQMGIADLEKYQPRPNRITASPNHITVESFTEYVNRFKSSDTIIEGSLSGSRFTARIDYHQPHGSGSVASIDMTPKEWQIANSPASWNTHNPVLVLKKTPDYAKIQNANSQMLEQLAFVHFLENLEHCILAPECAAINDMVLKFESITEARFTSKVNRVNGNITFVFSEEEKETSVKLPEKIVFRVAVYEASKPVEIVANLRYKAVQGKLFLWIEIPNFETIERNAFFAVAKEIEKGPELVATEMIPVNPNASGTGIKPYILA